MAEQPGDECRSADIPTIKRAAVGAAADEQVSQASDAKPGHADADWDEALEPFPPPLTRAEAQRLFGPAVSRRSRVTPFKVVAAQVCLTLCSTLAWWLLSSRPDPDALSALAGGSIAWLPGAMFVWRMGRAGRGESAGGWVLGEAIKLGLTILMFILIATLFKDVRWVPLLLTYLLALKTYWIALGLS